MTNEFFSEILWSLPDDQMFTVQYREHGGKWETTNEFNTYRKMKERASDLPDHKEVRVVRVSKYPPHSVVEVLFHRPSQR